MNITKCILRPALRCTALTVLWIAISASAQVAPSFGNNAVPIVGSYVDTNGIASGIYAVAK